MEHKYGGKSFALPDSHLAGMRVPAGGSNCLKCKWLLEDKKNCANKYFIEWNGSSKLPLPANEYCTDWYEPKEGALKHEQGGILNKKFGLNDEVK